MANHKKLRKMAFAKMVIPRSDMVFSEKNIIELHFLTSNLYAKPGITVFYIFIGLVFHGEEEDFHEVIKKKATLGIFSFSF